MVKTFFRMLRCFVGNIRFMTYYRISDYVNPKINYYIDNISYEGLASVEKPKVLCAVETVKFLINNRVSMSRFGDGEFEIIVGRSQHFQVYSDFLARRLKEVLLADIPGFMQAIPYMYWNDLSSYNVTVKDFVRGAISEKRPVYFKDLLMDKFYLDTGFTQFYVSSTGEDINYADYFEDIKKFGRAKVSLLFPVRE